MRARSTLACVAMVLIWALIAAPWPVQACAAWGLIGGMVWPFAKAVLATWAAEDIG